MTPVSGFRLDLHNHTTYSSDGVMQPAVLLHHAKLRGVDCIAITDHNTVQGGLVAAALAAADLSLPRVIPGVELATNVGEVIGLYVTEEIPAGLSLVDSIARIRAQGGLVYLPHPFDRLRRGAIAPRERLHAARLADIVEVVNGRSLSPRVIAKTAALAAEMEKPAGAGSDAHRSKEVGMAYVVVDELPTPQTLVALVAAGRLWHGLHSREYVMNWGFHGLSPVTRLRRRLVPHL
jgi:predicted metal-dependent phosphoesterase TrpH